MGSSPTTAESRPTAPPGAVVTDDLPERDRQFLSMCRASLAFFASDVLSGPQEAPYFGRWVAAEHHWSWDNLVQNHLKLCVLAPRDHGKTGCFGFAYPIWKAIHTPGDTGYIFSATQPQAEKILGDIKEEIEQNPRLQHLVPAKKSQWSARSIRLANGHRIYARGFGSKVRGAHPRWIVVDDGLNDESMYSETTRKKQIDYFFSAITNMLVPGGQLIVVSTPFHASDLYAVLATNPSYRFAKYPAIDKSGRPLWPDRYNQQLLDAKREEIGSIRFSREFLCEPVSDAMSLFPGHLFEGEPTEQFAVKLGMPLEFWTQLGVQIFMGVDFALSSSVSADYSVVWVMGKDRHGNRWIVDIVREKGLAYHRQLSLINTLARRYRPGLIFLEANQMQRIFGDELIRKTDLPIKPFVTTAQEKNSLSRGVPGLRTLLENHKVRIPRGDKRSVELTDLWKAEMQAFTWVDGKLQGLGAHDDLPMAFWIANQAINQGAFEFTFGGEADLADQDEIMRELTGVGTEDLGANYNPVDDGPDAQVPREQLAADDQRALDAVLASMQPKQPTNGKRLAPPKRQPATEEPPRVPVIANLLEDDPFFGLGVGLPLPG